MNRKFLFYEKRKLFDFKRYLSSSKIDFEQKKMFSKDGNFRKNTKRHGAYSMIIKKSGIDKILDFYEKRGIFLPYDRELSAIPDLNTYNLIEKYTAVETQISDTY